MQGEVSGDGEKGGKLHTEMQLTVWDIILHHQTSQEGMITFFILHIQTLLYPSAFKKCVHSK